MMLIDEVIDLLSNESSSLSGALLKTSVLLHRLGKRDLAEWVKHELEGYPTDAVLPSYRVLPAQVFGDASNMVYSFTNYQMPTKHLNEETQQNLSCVRFNQPLNSLEELLKDGNQIICRLPIEFCPKLSRGLANDIQVSSAWLSVSGASVKGMFMQIRAKLLDFLLSLKDSLGDFVQEDEMKKKAASIDTNTMFKNAIFGPNATVIVGNNNATTVANVIKNDFDSLSDQLSLLGVAPKDVSSLKKAIDADVKKTGAPALEGKTGGWLNKMLAGAKNGTLGVTVEAVSGGITKALLDYIG